MPTDRLYTGQRLESSLDLYDYRARMYDPLVGSFLSPDSIVPQPGQPVDWNRFAYVRGNPVRYSDPSGHCIGFGCIPDERTIQLIIDFSESAYQSIDLIATDIYIEGGSGRFGSSKLGGERVYDFTTKEIGVFSYGGFQPGSNMLGIEGSIYFGAGYKGNLINDRIELAYKGAFYSAGGSYGLPADAASFDIGGSISGDGDFSIHPEQKSDPPPRLDAVKTITFGGSIGLAASPPHNLYGSATNYSYYPGLSKQFEGNSDMIRYIWQNEYGTPRKAIYLTVMTLLNRQRVPNE